MVKKDDFKFIVPAQLSKSKEGKWKVKGLASAEVKDRQGEIILQKGIDCSPIDQKKGFLNWDHDNSPESTIGLLTGYHREDGKTYIEGELFQKHERAKAVYSIMESLAENGSNAMGLSIEGKILQRNDKDPNIIEKCIVRNVALTLNPVFSDSFVNLVKAFNSAENIEFDSNGTNLQADPIELKEKPVFTANQVIDMLQKALSVGSGGIDAPNTRIGGDALAQSTMKDSENEEKEEEKTKKQQENQIIREEKAKANQQRKIENNEQKKVMNKGLYKSLMIDILDKMQVLYPNCTRSEIWEAVRDRVENKLKL